MDIALKNFDARRFQRIQFRRPVKFGDVTGDGLPAHLAQDISQGGLRVMSSDFVALHTPLSVQLQLKDTGRIIELKSRVVWVRYNPLAETYQMGLEFADDLDPARQMIGQFVRGQ
jgi:c-di-GMP-binding flagellar brake protein YcgR